MRQVFRDIGNFLFNVDSPFWVTQRLAYTNPGKLSRSFIDGQRRTYFHPIRFFIVATAFYYLFVWIFDFNPVKFSYQSMGQGELYDEHGQDITIRMSDIIRKNINILMFIWVFVASGLDRLFYRKTPYNIAERSVLYFYTIGAYIIAYSPFIALSAANISPDIVRASLVIFFFPYAVMSFHRKKGFLKALAALGHVILTFTLYVLIISIIILAVLYAMEYNTPH